MRTRSRFFALLGILLAFSLLATACAGDDEPSAPDPGAAPAAPAGEAEEMDDAEDMDDAAPAPAPAPDDDAAPAPPPAADDAAPADDDAEPATAADAAEPMVIGPPEVDLIRVCAAPSFTQMYAEVMVSQGFLSDRGTEIEFVACLSGPAQAAALVSRQVDIALNTPDNMLGIRNADFDVVMFAQIVDTHFFDIVVSNNFGQIDCAEGDWECAMAALEGTRVGVVARGAAAEQIARQLLDSAGFDPDDSTYIATGLSGTTLAALASDEIDWTITFEPGLTRAELDGIGYRPFRLQAGHGPAELDWPSAILLTARDFWDSNPNTVLHYREAMVEAVEWMRDPANRDELLAGVVDFLGLELDMAAHIVDNNIGSYTVTGVLDPVRIGNNVNYAVGRGILAEAQQFGEFAVGPDIDAILPEELVAETDHVLICQAPSFNGLTVHVAVEKGFLGDRGVDGEFVQCHSGPANAAALIAGEVNFSINTPDNMLGIRNAGFDVVLFQQIQDTHFFDIIISENFGPIDCELGDWQCTMAALEGTSVGVVARGAAAEQIARQLYDSAGFDPDGATYIATGLAGTTLAALSSGEVDWAITFEPGLSQAVIDGIGYSPFTLRTGQGPTELDWPSAVNTTSREFFQNNPNTVAIYARSVRDAMDWMRNPANHPEVLDLMESFLGLDRSVAEVVLASNIGSFSLNGRPDPRRLGNNVNYAVGRGILEEAQDFDDFAVTP
ncbi:MAG: ABC transporter substrate-binding protein [Acidimicrobiia bacterium]|nr:ABC transporter substrate-binding protein [Acidimicrobiia bacterium]MYC45488.1 ABC transporter substrate-binding protein [Acidimicrobiia bacterium]MYI18730.1 ABC transporter substrate-binding protein [Acidimicrobiia bacterium]